MRHIKPFNESVESNTAYGEFKLLKTKVSKIFKYLGIDVFTTTERGNNNNYYFQFEFRSDGSSVPYSILNIISSVKSDTGDSIKAIQTIPDNMSADTIRQVAIAETKDQVAKGVIVINPANAKDGYNKIISLPKPLGLFYESHKLSTIFFQLNKDYFETDQIITNKYIIGRVIDAVSKYKQPYKVVQKIKENNPDLYNKMVELKPDVEHSDDLSQMGFDDN